MALIKLSDGTEITVSDQPNAEELAAIRAAEAVAVKRGPNATLAEDAWDGIKRTGASAVAGLDMVAPGLAALPMAAARGISALKTKYLGPSDPESQYGKQEAQLNRPNFLDKYIAENRDFAEKEGLQTPALKGAAEGAAAGSLAGPPGMVVGGLSGALSEWVRNKYGDVPGMLAGVVSGYGLGKWLGPTGLNSAEERIRQATKGTSAAEFQAAEKNRALFDAVKAKTATVPDLFEGNVPLKGLAYETIPAKGGEVLRNQVSGREEDLKQLGETFKDNIGPVVNSREVSGRTVAAADAAVDYPRQLAATNIETAFAGVKVPKTVMEDLHTELLRRARAAPDEATSEGYKTVARALMDKRGRQPLENLQDISLAIVRLKKTPMNPVAGPVGGARVKQMDTQIPIMELEQELGAVVPLYAKAKLDFKAMREVGTGWQNNQLGGLASKNPNNAAVPSSTRLGNIISGEDPQGVTETLRLIGYPHIPRTDASTVTNTEIARAWAQQKLRKGSTDSGKLVRGMEGSDEDKAVQALIAATGKNPAGVMAPLRASDKLQRFTGEGGSTNDLRSSRMAMLAQPFATIKYIFNQAARTKDYEQISELLKDPKNLEQIQKIAQFDPVLRKQFSAYMAVQGGIQGGN